MNAAVEILAPTNPEKVRRAIRGLEKTRVSRTPSKGMGERMLVAWVSDLSIAKRRKELDQLIDVTVKGSKTAPFILVTTKSTRSRNHKALETLTRWGRLPGFYLAPDLVSVRRVVRAHLAGAETKLIASALIDDDKLVVWSCEPRRYVVPVASIPVLANMNPRARENFEINEVGSRIHWDHGDVDLNLDSIRYYTDPKVKQAQDKAYRDEAARYAGAISSFRKEKKLTQSNIAGLTERQVRRIERGENVPQSESLRKLATAHGLKLDEYLSELAKRTQVVER